jgi:hypothetical protein
MMARRESETVPDQTASPRGAVPHHENLPRLFLWVRKIEMSEKKQVSELMEARNVIGHSIEVARKKIMGT